MHRKEREITDIHTIEQIVAGARILHLGMNDDGAPYVVPMHYGYRVNGIPFVPQKLRNFPAILEHRKIQTNPL